MQFTFITPVTAIPCPRLRKDFSCASVKSAVLSITGLGLYRAFLNGERIGRDYLTPGFNDYDAYLRYQTYDVTSLMQQENRLEVWLGNGWYKGRLGFDGGRTDRWGDRYLLALRLEITLAGGESFVLETDDTWKAFLSPVLDGGIYDGEIRDDTRDPGPEIPCAAVRTDYHTEPQFSPCIRSKGELKPVLIRTPAGEQVLDFGQNMAGIIRFVNRLPRGESLRIQTGEVLQNGNFYRDNLRTALSEFRYTSDGLEKTVEPLFTFYGFRYAKVEGPDPVDPGDFTAVCLSSDLPETLEVHTGHEKLNRLMENCLWGQRSNFLDVPTDCPQRDERLGWTADTQVFVNTACYQMDCRDFYRKYMRDLRADQQMYYQNDLPAFSPSLRGEAGPGGAVWADAGTIIPWNIYMNYGDMELLRENYPMMRDYAETLIAADRAAGGSHLVFRSFTFGDWLALDGLTPQSVKGGTPDAYIQGIYYMNSIQLTARAADRLGETQDAEKYRSLAREIRAALLDEYFSPNGNLTADTQTGYVLALYYGVYRDREKLLAGFRRRLQRDYYRITCGFTGAPLMLPVLLDHGMEDIAFRILLSEEFPGWLYAVNLGATTVWERWNSLNPDGSVSGTGMNSLNHYAYGSVCEAVYSRIMGLQNAAPGWKKARIAPHIHGKLREASIRFASPAGVWRSAWSIAPDGTVTLKVSVPEGASARVVLPDHPDGLSPDVPAGEYEWSWHPVKDYLHPLSADSLLPDLLDNPQAADLLKNTLPSLYDSLQGFYADLKVLTLRQAAESTGIGPDVLSAAESGLRKIPV